MIQFACVGLDHRHIYGMTEGLLAAGAKCVGYYTRDEAEPLEGFTRRFPDVPVLISQKFSISVKTSS